MIATHGSPHAPGHGNRSSRLEVPGGEVAVWTTPYAPYFGSEELNLLRTLAASAMVALDRARLFAHERDMRVALERADEVKTNFVALAAHELRTPVSTVHGLVETIQLRRADLDRRQLAEIEGVLRSQTQRLKSPVQASQNDRHFRLTVEDRGGGVAPEFVPDLFERFSRSERSRERVSGTGLGLAIARSYAQAHHGDLFYEPAQPRVRVSSSCSRYGRVPPTPPTRVGK